MAKRTLEDSRYDFRKGRNTAIAPDLLNIDELIDTTNARLVSSYGAFTKRSGCQRIHPDVFPAGVNGVTQWDTPSGKQVVVISNGDLYYRDGFDFGTSFTKATSAGVARTTANQGAAAGWTGASNSLNGPVPTNTTVAAGTRIICKLGDPAINNNVDAADDLYLVTFNVIADGTAMSGTYAAIGAFVDLEVSTDGGATYPNVFGTYSATTSIGHSSTKHYAVNVTASGAPAQVWVRLKLTLTVQGTGTSGNGVGTVSVANGAVNYPVTWSTGAARFAIDQPAIFAPFRASTAGAPLVLYIASGGHYYSWALIAGVWTIAQLDPTNSAPLTTSILSYHTRMFAMSASSVTPGLLPKTLFWSLIGDATDFRTGDKTKGGSAVTDFLTGQQLTALEVIGSSLLMATIDSVMRFTGQSSDDIVIAQNTEGISAEVGAIGLLTLKRFENVAAMLAIRGPYVVTETSATPIGEQVLPDFNSLDTANVSKSVIEYNRGQKELLFAVPGAGDSGLNKTIFVQAVRLQAWYGPWTYSFGINCMCQYIGASGIENVLSGGSDGFVRLMDVGLKDDVLSDGTGGTNITMTVEIPPIHFGQPGVTKTLKMMKMQAILPNGHNFLVKTAFDGDALSNGAFVDATYDGTLRDYRVDLDGQGKRLRNVYTDNSAVKPQVNGFTMYAYDMQRP